jgi:hypothetical protein
MLSKPATVEHDLAAVERLVEYAVTDPPVAIDR